MKRTGELTNRYFYLITKSYFLVYPMKVSHILKIFLMNLSMRYLNFWNFIMYIKLFSILIYDFIIFLLIQLFRLKLIFHLYQNQLFNATIEISSYLINIELIHFVYQICIFMILSFYHFLNYQNLSDLKHLFLIILNKISWKSPFRRFMQTVDKSWSVSYLP